MVRLNPQLSELHTQITYAACTGFVAILLVTIGGVSIAAGEPIGPMIAIVGFVALAFGFGAWRHLQSVRNLARASRGQAPLWLRQKRGDDWSRGILRRRPRLRPWAVPVAFTWSFVTASFIWPPSQWLAAAGVAAAASFIYPIYTLVAWMRSGRATLVAGQLPARLGHPFSGRIETSLRTAPLDGFRVRLVCLHCVETEEAGFGETVLWERSSVVAPQPHPAGGTLSVPFSFVISGAHSPTNLDHSADSIEWRLEVKASLPGIKFATSFEVPVVADETQYGTTDHPR